LAALLETKKRICLFGFTKFNSGAQLFLHANSFFFIILISV
jgi:hypothetical protein